MSQHRPDVPSLLAGLVTAVVCAALAFGDLDTIGEISAIVWPTVLAGTGIALLLQAPR